MFKAPLAEEDSGLLGFGTVVAEFYWHSVMVLPV